MSSVRVSTRWYELGCVVLCLLIAVAPSRSGATVLQGPIVNLPEAYVVFTWGDGQHDLYQEWSVANANLGRGWFYGSTYFPGMSNADVYVYPNLPDPTMVTNAETFTYDNVALIASEGDCVFFRGLNGYYGVWRIDAIDPLPNPPPYGELDGRWYFQDDGTGNFSQPTPVAASTWGSIKALLK